MCHVLMFVDLEAVASSGKLRLLVLVLAVALVFSALCVGGACGADVWDGTSNTTWYTSKPSSTTTYTIYTAEELAGLAQLVNSGNNFTGKIIYLGDDIDLNNRPWTPIGNSDSRWFKGTFNGTDHSIDNLFISYKSNSVVGLFGYVDSGNIHELNIVRSKFTPTDNGKNSFLGSVVGWLHNGVVQNCSVIVGVDITTGNQGNDKFTIGGLIGKITAGNNKESISASEINNHLKGHCSVAVLSTNYKKSWGLLVGNPSIGEIKDSGGSGGTADVHTVIYTVEYYTMQTNGSYLNETRESVTSAVNEVVTAKFVVPDGYYLNSVDSSLSGLVSSDGKLVLTVYFDILVSYKITIPSTLIIKTDTKTGTLPITATELWILDYGWVDISVSSEHDFHLAYEGKQEGPFVKYELRLGNSIINDNSVAATFRDGSSKPGPLETPRTVSLTAELTGHPPYVGSYNDILTFTAEYKESVPART